MKYRSVLFVPGHEEKKIKKAYTLSADLVVLDLESTVPDDQKENAKKIIKETKCDAVKLEGGKKIINQINFLIKKKISVMGHLGLLPQTAKGKFKSKGNSSKETKQLINDALLLQNAGVFAIVLECIKSPTAKLITKSLEIPTIGIGSSVNCDGQVLVTDDLIAVSYTHLTLPTKRIV